MCKGFEPPISWVRKQRHTRFLASSNIKQAAYLNVLESPNIRSRRERARTCLVLPIHMNFAKICMNILWSFDSLSSIIHPSHFNTLQKDQWTFMDYLKPRTGMPPPNTWISDALLSRTSDHGDSWPRSRVEEDNVEKSSSFQSQMPPWALNSDGWHLLPWERILYNTLFAYST